MPGRTDSRPAAGTVTSDTDAAAGQGGTSGTCGKDEDGTGDHRADGGRTGGTAGGAGQGGNGNSPAEGSPGAAGGPGGEAGLAANIALTITLPTLVGLAEHPGEAHGLGAIDPDLARQMAAAAARNGRSKWCVTVTDDQGHTIGHGCAKPVRNKGKPRPPRPNGTRDGPSFGSLPGQLGRVGPADQQVAGVRAQRDGRAVKDALDFVAALDHRPRRPGPKPQAGSLAAILAFRRSVPGYRERGDRAHKDDRVQVCVSGGDRLALIWLKPRWL
jgi:hypothetical protein